MAQATAPGNGNTPPSIGSIIGTMAIFVILGFPLIGYLWETLNQVLALQFNTTRILITIPVVLLIVVVLRFLSRQVRRWQPS